MDVEARQTERGKILENFYKNFVCKTKAIRITESPRQSSRGGI